MIQTKVSATGEEWNMLEPKDLRIGNILLYKDDYVHVTCVSLDIDDEYQETIGFCIVGKNTGEQLGWNRSMPDLKAVELTDDLLDKCGFESKRSDAILGAWAHYQRIINRYQAVYLWSGDGGVHFRHNGYTTFIHYLHQLQNLYFALTGQELQVNL